MSRFVDNVKDTDFKYELVLHSNSMSPKGIENVCGPGEIQHQLGRTGMSNSLDLH